MAALLDDPPPELPRQGPLADELPGGDLEALEPLQMGLQGSL